MVKTLQLHSEMVSFHTTVKTALIFFRVWVFKCVVCQCECYKCV